MKDKNDHRLRVYSNTVFNKNHEEVLLLFMNDECCPGHFYVDNTYFRFDYLHAQIFGDLRRVFQIETHRKKRIFIPIEWVLAHTVGNLREFLEQTYKKYGNVLENPQRNP